MTNQPTVRDVTYDLLRTLGLTTVFGNPGSTEETFLRNFPDDFTYVLGLQDASVLAMADGFAQSTGKPALVNVHTGAGTGNAMGSLIAAYKGNTPLIVTAGQQTREMVGVDPAAGFGCHAVDVNSIDKLADEFNAALHADGPTVIVVPTKPKPAHLG